jgi:hypothetical protein
LKYKNLYIVIFVVGIGIGAISMYGLTPHLKPLSGDQEEESQERIRIFQNALTNAGTPEDIEKVSKKLEAQMRLEDLIVKSREAQYTKFTLLSPLIVSVIALLSAAISAIITSLVVRRGPKDTPASTNKDNP